MGIIRGFYELFAACYVPDNLAEEIRGMLGDTSTHHPTNGGQVPLTSDRSPVDQPLFDHRGE